MKVISQLSRHFWSRGALTAEQAEYLVRHGFVRARDLDGFTLREGRASRWEDDPVPKDEAPVPPGEAALEVVAEALERRTAVGRRGGRAGRKPLTLGGLCERLRGEFGRRAVVLEALIVLARPLVKAEGWEDAAVALRNASDEEFNDALGEVPTRLAAVWLAVAPEPFHTLVEGDDIHGPSVNALKALLQGGDAARIGKYAWILKAAEVAGVVNLLSIHRRLLSSLHALYLDGDPALAAMLRGGLPRALHCAFVLLYSADRHAADHPSSLDGRFGPARACPHTECGDEATLEQATTLALLMDPESFPRLLAMEEGGGPLARPRAWRVARGG